MDTTPKNKVGRRCLSLQERRVDRYRVNLNAAERRRLQRLSGQLQVREAEVLREGLLALEREVQRRR